MGRYWHNAFETAMDDDSLNIFNATLLLALSVTCARLGYMLYESYQGGGGQANAAAGGAGGGGGGGLGIYFNQDFFNGAMGAALVGGTTYTGYMLFDYFMNEAATAASGSGTSGYSWMMTKDVGHIDINNSPDISQDLGPMVKEMDANMI